jgi:uncharacterized protein YbjQ (UPF0145 family)
MENPFSADKSSPFLTPYQPPGAPAPAPAIKPFAAVDLAPPAGQNGNRHSSPPPQASPFLGKGDFGNAFAAPAAPASPVQAAPVAAPTLPVSSLAQAFSPTPTSAAAGVAPFAPKHTAPPPPADYTPVPEPSVARVERPAPFAAPIASSAPPVPPAATLAPPRRGAGTETLAKSTLQMTDADAPTMAPTPAVAKPGLLVTTGPSVDGRRIMAYLGIVSVEIVIPKDVLFRNPAPYGELHRIKAAEDQLQRVKQKAFEELSDRARALGADGIVGATLQFSQFDAVVFLCAAAGTAVTLSGP